MEINSSKKTAAETLLACTVILHKVETAEDIIRNQKTADIKKMVEDEESKKMIRQQQRKLREQQELELKKEQARKSMKFLLSKSLKYSNFFKQKFEEHKLAKETSKNLQRKKHQMTDVLMDCMFKENAKTEDCNTNGDTVDIVNQIKYFEGGVLKPYQVDGLTWMTILYENGVNGILADEMGLGKTIQVIALMCHLYEREVPGPFLIVAPLSTIPNWQSEFKRFAPKIPVVVFYGDRDERRKLRYVISHRTYMVGNRHVKPVVITTYQMPLMEEIFFGRIHWQYAIIDEGHRIKNHNSRLAQVLRRLHSPNKLLLTGTPLQNNMTELWALLNYLVPHIFTDIDAFASLFNVEDMEDNDKLLKDEESTNIISTVHKVLAPFMLRRLKCEVLHDLVPKKEVSVYCPMTKLQSDLYMYSLEKNIAKLKGITDEEDENYILPKRKRPKVDYQHPSMDDYRNADSGFKELQQTQHVLSRPVNKDMIPYIATIKLQNSHMMYRRVVGHPYLVRFPLDPKSETPTLLINEDLVKQSGKMLVLDAMLAKLKEGSHKVLIFSNFVMVLDLMEDYMIMRNYNYRVLSGNQKIMNRQQAVDDFNNNPDVFCFLISTKAGGLGLNLTGADTVIFYDRDWNPQTDIQAQDRCHRIGQTKPVMIYTLVTQYTIEEKIIHCGTLKRRLEKIVIKDGKFKSIAQDTKAKELDLQELEDLKQLFESGDCSTKIHSNGNVFTEQELKELLDRTELYEQMKELTSS